MTGPITTCEFLERARDIACDTKTQCAGISAGPLTPPSNQSTLVGRLNRLEDDLEWLRTDTESALKGPITVQCPPVDTSSMGLDDVTEDLCAKLTAAYNKHCVDDPPDTNAAKCLVQQCLDMIPAARTKAAIT